MNRLTLHITEHVTDADYLPTPDMLLDETALDESLEALESMIVDMRGVA